MQVRPNILAYIWSFTTVEKLLMSGIISRLDICMFAWAQTLFIEGNFVQRYSGNRSASHRQYVFWLVLVVEGLYSSYKTTACILGFEKKNLLPLSRFLVWNNNDDNKNNNTLSIQKRNVKRMIRDNKQSFRRVGSRIHRRGIDKTNASINRLKRASALDERCINYTHNNECSTVSRLITICFWMNFVFENVHDNSFCVSAICLDPTVRS